MKIAIYTPYLDTAGGGEKYMLTIAEVLCQSHQVDILLDPHLSSLNLKEMIERIEDLHGLDLSKVNFVPAPIGKNTGFWRKFLFLRKYNYLFSNTDGSIFFSTAKNSIIHFQVPFENTSCQNLWGKIKLASWKMALYNSQFTKNIIEQTWPIKGLVVYPPVSTDLFLPLVKKKQIVSVGRFFGAGKDKKHEVLIKTFQQLEKTSLKNWSLHLAGGASLGDKPYIEELKNMAKGSKIYFYPDASLGQLKKLYGESSIYWHAKGYGEEDPKKAEHFGITTVEAMAAGAVPVVINQGGQPEIVIPNVSGFLWNDLEQLNQYTLQLVNNSDLLAKMSQNAVQRAKAFSKDKFAEAIKQLVI